MGGVVFATSLHVGICRMGMTLFGDDIAQKSVNRMLWRCASSKYVHRLVMLSLGRCVIGILGCWCPVKYNDTSVK